MWHDGDSMVFSVRLLSQFPGVGISGFSQNGSRINVNTRGACLSSQDLREFEARQRFSATKKLGVAFSLH